MENKFYTVYEHITPSNKRYIGITCQKPECRWGKDGKNYMKNSKGKLSYFGKAILKYGWNNIEHTILFENLSKDEANKKEKELIKQYNTTDKNFGYNISIGGDVRGKSRKTKCIETGQEFETAVEAGNYFNIPPANIMCCCQGKSKTAGGYHWEYINYNKTPLLPKRRSKEMSNKKQPVRCIETGETYTSIAEASRDIGITRNSIQVALWYPDRTAKGFHFEYVEGERKAFNLKPIVCVETGKVFESSVEASKFVNRDRSTIRVALREPHRTCGGYHWKYLEKEAA